MSDTIDDIKDDIDIENSNIGLRAYFINPYGKIDEVWRFASELHMIGHEWDRELKNHTEVLVVSESVTVNHPLRGKLPVIKIMHKDSMWIPTELLVIIKEKL